MSLTNGQNSGKADGTAITKKVEVLPYDPAWQDGFKALRQYLQSILFGQDVRVEHVGSTSVPGLAAKPIIDIDIVLQNGENFEAVKNALEANGYTHVGDLGITGREVFKYETKPQFMPHHLYALSDDSEELKRHLTFRDWLRSHPADKEAYARVKIAAARQFPNNIDGYIDAKSDIIFDIYQRCGLYQAQLLPELACSVVNNRYGLRVVKLNCKQMQPGISLCEAHTAQGAFYLLAWERAGFVSGEISVGQDTPELTTAHPLPTASGQTLCRTPFAAFALFGTEQDALTFLNCNLWQ